MIYKIKQGAKKFMERYYVEDQVFSDGDYVTINHDLPDDWLSLHCINSKSTVELPAEWVEQADVV